MVDTIKLAKKEFPGQTVNLDSLCKKLSIVNTRQDYHGALLDANLLSKVYLKLTTGKQENLNLIDNEISSFSNNQDFNDYKTNFLVPREKLMQLSSNELAQHENFIKGMGNPLWKKIK